MKLTVYHLSFVVTIFLLCSCSSSIQLTDKGFNHMIALHGDGNSYEIENISEGYFYQKHIQTIMDNIVHSDKKDILIYIHGGMKDIDESIEEAEEQTEIISNSTDYYPIYINWDSGFNSSYFEQLLFLRRGKRESVLGPLTAPFHFVSDFCHAVLQTPVTLGDEIYRYIFNSSSPDLSNYNSESESGNLSIDSDYSKFSDNGSHFTDISVYLLGGSPKLLTTPIVDAFGKKAWINMKRRTREIFQNGSKEINQNIEYSDSSSIQFAGGLCKLMNELSDLVRHNPDYQFTLIGHSMGTMIINEIIRLYPHLNYKNIVYMAAACSISDFENSVIPYIQQSQHSGTKFYNLTLHPLNELNERMYGDMILKGSFLEWIDGFLNNPTSLTERTMGKWENINKAVHTFPDSLLNRIVIKKFSGGYSRVTEPEPNRHGDFNDTLMRFWEEQFWHNNSDKEKSKLAIK